MKRLKKYLLFILLLILIPSVNAEECSNAEKVALGKEATNIKVGYEEREGVVDPNSYTPPEGASLENYVQYYNYFSLKFTNISENITIKLENDVTSDSFYINYNNTNAGTYYYDWKRINKVTKFTYTIYGSENTNCYLEKLKSGIITTPAYNMYYTSQRCQKAPEYYLCQKYINSNIDYATFSKNIDKYIEQKEKKAEEEKKKKEEDNFLKKISVYIKDNKTKVLIVSLILVIIVGVVVVIIIRKRKERVI